METLICRKRYDKNLKSLAGFRTAFAAALFLAAAQSFAAAPPALTNIGNTASASFTDAAGRSNQITSNPVVTVVQQVGAFALDGVTTVGTTVINTKTGAAGTTVHAPHVLTNTGNGTDLFNISVVTGAGKFSKVEVYADGGSGLPTGAPLCSSTGPTACATTAPISLAGSSGIFRFIVAYTIPATAAGNETPFETSTLTVSPITASNSMYAVTSVAAKDSINLTNGAAFAMTKAIAVPTVNAPGGGAWPTASASGKASSSATCATTWTAGLSSSSSCVYTVYTLTFSNVGAVAGRLALSDQLPAGLSYVAGSAVWSSASGTALTDAAGGDPAGIEYQAASGKLTAVVTSVPPGASQTLSFVALVNNTATAGTQRTTNVGMYNSGDAGTTATASAPGPMVTQTSGMPYVVYGTAGVAVGSLTSTSVTALDAVAGTPNTSNADNTSIASVTAGTLVKFPLKVYNLGDTTDTINVSVTNGTFPAGTTFFLFSSDGFTVLNDTGVLDGIPDTGPIPANGQVTMVVGAQLPAVLPVGNVTFTATATGTSRNDPTRKDAAFATVTSISRGLVDLTNTPNGNGVSASGNGDVGPGPSPDPTTINTTTAGVATGFNLYIANGDSVSRTYSLAASASTAFPGNLPAGWTVKFLAGANAACTATAAGLSDSGVVAAGGQNVVTACVTPAVQQLPVTAQRIYFRVLATTATAAGSIAVDVKTDAVTVTTTAAQNYSAALTGNNMGQVVSPGSTVYSHLLTNVGLQTCGSYTLAANFSPAETSAGWVAVVYIDNDNNGQISAGDLLVTNAAITKALPPGAANAHRILVSVSAPAGLSVGATSTATLTASFATPNSCGTLSVIDQTTISSGSIRLYKTQALDAACDGTADAPLAITSVTAKPGSCIYYQVRAVNEGLTVVNNLSIHDRAPAFTTLSATAATPQCSATGTTGTQPTYSASGADVTCGSASSVLSPSGIVTLNYIVLIDQ